MKIITHDFIKRFSHFKRQAINGATVKLTDREGHCFVFKMEKTAGHSGAGRKLSKGVSLSPAPVDKSEWKYIGVLPQSFAKKRLARCELISDDFGA